MNNKRLYTYGKQTIKLDDIWGVVKVLMSPWLTQGPTVAKFEKKLCEYTGAKYTVAVSNGTGALHLAMLALGLGPGDEIITSPITFLASANCALYVGAKVTFADIESDTALIDPFEIKKKITSRTKVIIPVHYAGQSCDMEKIAQIAKEHNLYVVEDAAHTIGSEYQGEKVGACKYADMTIFSFHPVKNITTGEGGAITTNNPDLYERLLMLRSHGVIKDKDKFINPSEGEWYYEMQILGYNYRMSDIQAALGISQLKKLDKFIEKRRSLVCSYYNEFCEDQRFRFLVEKDYSKAAFHLMPVLIDFKNMGISKKEYFSQMLSNGLALQVHYIPIHLQPFYSKYGYSKGPFPKAESYYSNTVSLPLYPGLNKSDIQIITRILKQGLDTKT